MLAPNGTALYKYFCINKNGDCELGWAINLDYIAILYLIQ